MPRCPGVRRGLAMEPLTWLVMKTRFARYKWCPPLEPVQTSKTLHKHPGNLLLLWLERQSANWAAWFLPNFLFFSMSATARCNLGSSSHSIPTGISTGFDSWVPGEILESDMLVCKSKFPREQWPRHRVSVLRAVSWDSWPSPRIAVCLKSPCQA